MAFTPYITCDNKNESFEQIFKKLLIADSDGSPVLKTTSFFRGLSEKRKVDLTNAPYEAIDSASNLFGWNIINPNASAIYVKFYDGVAGGVTVGTTIPKLTIKVPASDTVYIAPNCIQEEFVNGIVMAVTTGVDDADNTAPASAVHAHIKIN